MSLFGSNELAVLSNWEITDGNYIHIEFSKKKKKSLLKLRLRNCNLIQNEMY